MTYSLQNKVILITGAGSGIGRETALLMGQHGAELVLSDINVSAGEEVAALILEQGGRAYFKAADVANASQVEALHQYIVDTCSGLDCAINSAGIEHDNLRLTDCDEELFDHVIDINLKGIFLCMREQLKIMQAKGHGHIINLASVAGIKGAPTLAPYAASKFGVIGLTRTAALEYARRGIRVNAVCPSFINTPMVQRSLKMMDEKTADSIRHASPMKRLGEPLEVARTLAWLASDESSFMNGHSVVLDGGLTV
ncbi:SDR family NAD(P)-dependent oxidoreductase [Hahella ganghwensis]|uniref:SDR family NAD(P)-dependent oxidoreductase n=1 Tax=Hahella ganghwensis TaxID=286420 RepID=UPI000376F2B7|nr:glucose 1-dehydrogenase [Hahella ganghwensis]